MMLPLWRDTQQLANKDINTTCDGRPAKVAHDLQLFSCRNTGQSAFRSAPEGYPDRAIGADSALRRLVRQSRAMASARKPVIVRKFSRDWIAGYAAAEFGQTKPELEFLDLTGRVVRMGWEQVKWMCYVRALPAAPRTRQTLSGWCANDFRFGRARRDCGCASPSGRR